MGQGSRRASVIYPLKESNRGKGHYGLLLFTPDRVKLAVNSKKETNSRVKMGKRSRWASVIYLLKKSESGLLLFTPSLRQTNSEQQERNKQQGQNGQRVKTSVI